MKPSTKSTDPEFASIVKSYLGTTGTAQGDLADVFEVAESTVSRWANGVARPHRLLRKQVVEHISNLCK